MLVSAQQLHGAFDTWLTLEREHTAMPDAGRMRMDLLHPPLESLHGRKTHGHMGKAKFRTNEGLAATGDDSVFILAKAANVWGKLVAGAVVRTRYLTTQTQDEFWAAIRAQACDIPEGDRLNAAVAALPPPTPCEVHEQIALAWQQQDDFMQALYDAASSGEHEELIEASIPLQDTLYRLALGCVAVQLDRTDGDLARAGIMEPGRDGEAEIVLSLGHLLSQQAPSL